MNTEKYEELPFINRRVKKEQNSKCVKSSNNLKKNTGEHGYKSEGLFTSRNSMFAAFVKGGTD